MRIVIEFSPQLGGKRGIGVYTENLIRELAKIDQENEYILFGWFFRNFSEKKRMLYCPQQENFSLMVKRFPDSLMNKLEWGLNLPIIYNFLRKQNVDLYHSPGPRLPNLKNIKQIITIHDLIHEIYPQWVDNRFLNANRKAVSVADKIIVDSQNTKSDLIRFYGTHPEKIDVIYLGVDKKIFRPIVDNSLQKIKEKYTLPEKFILDVGPFEHRRNIESLLHAYKRLKERMPRYKVVLVGTKNQNLEREIYTLNLDSDVIFTDYVPQNDLVCIYNLATVFVHPSFYEGFGLQVLEAMACGCPVIASNVSSLPEVIGNAGVLVDPNSTDNMAEAICGVVSNENMRAELSAKGTARAKEFLWENTAKKTLEIYKSVCHETTSFSHN